MPISNIRLHLDTFFSYLFGYFMLQKIIIPFCFISIDWIWKMYGRWVYSTKWNSPRVFSKFLSVFLYIFLKFCWKIWVKVFLKNYSVRVWTCWISSLYLNMVFRARVRVKTLFHGEPTCFFFVLAATASAVDLTGHTTV